MEDNSGFANIREKHRQDAIDRRDAIADYLGQFIKTDMRRPGYMEQQFLTMKEMVDNFMDLQDQGHCIVLTIMPGSSVGNVCTSAFYLACWAKKNVMFKVNGVAFKIRPVAGE